MLIGVCPILILSVTCPSSYALLVSARARDRARCRRLRSHPRTLAIMASSSCPRPLSSQRWARRCAPDEEDRSSCSPRLIGSNHTFSHVHMPSYQRTLHSIASNAIVVGLHQRHYFRDIRRSRPCPPPRRMRSSTTTTCTTCSCSCFSSCSPWLMCFVLGGVKLW
jgi:hypothetical protein